MRQKDQRVLGVFDTEVKDVLSCYITYRKCSYGTIVQSHYSENRREDISQHIIRPEQILLKYCCIYQVQKNSFKMANRNIVPLLEQRLINMIQLLVIY